jgi:peptidyl-prolyl cis-trans isomerase A (cyclophilin A)
MVNKSNKDKITIFIILFAVLALAIIVIPYLRMEETGKVVENQKTQVKITTSKGELIAELYPNKAPISVENFLSYVEDGTYENTVFHRVIPDFMIQGGGFTSDGNEKPTKSPIKLESNNGLNNLKGTLAMARTMDPDSATNQFFINTNDNPFLDAGVRDDGYAVFGKVIQGMEIVDSIGQVDTTTKNGMSDWPVEDIIIQKIEVI